MSCNHDPLCAGLIPTDDECRMIYPRECYEHSRYDPATEELLLRRDKGMYVPFIASLLLANATQAIMQCIYLAKVAGKIPYAVDGNVRILPVEETNRPS